MPNSEVKRRGADGSVGVTPCESRSPPDYKIQTSSARMGFFYCCYTAVILLLLLLLLLLFVERMISDDEVISCRANGYDELISNQNLYFSLIN